ncbi:MAG: adenylate kinase [Saprospiraceae bacterium]
MLNLILFGPPGSGKGTQAENIIEKYNILHLSTGDMFRFELSNNTELGQLAKSYMNRGELVPDSVTIAMLEQRVNANPDAKGIIFDGFPRTVAQAEALDSFLASKGTEISLLIALDVPEEELLRRLLDRGKSSGRADDSDVNIIKNRISVYGTETSPVFDFYFAKHKAKKIDGLGTVEEIFDRISGSIDPLV